MRIEIEDGDFLKDIDIYIDDEHFVVCRNIRLNLTRENLSDFEMQTGFSRFELIKWHYINSVAYQRGEKINKILDEEL